MVTRTTLRGYAVALKPPAGAESEHSPAPLPTPSPLGPAPRSAPRSTPIAARGDAETERSPEQKYGLLAGSPAEPEIETYLEIEAELPPEPGGDADMESQRALHAALGDDPDGEHRSVSITIEEDSTRVIETVTETPTQTLTLTVTEPTADEPAPPRAITGQEGATVSGTIPGSLSAPHGAKLHSEGRKD
jgi:hypothetical protein